MSCEIIALSPFRREAKKLIKKYPSLQEELGILASKLTENPVRGTPLGQRYYKVRLLIYSKGKGKSGGVQVITYFKAQQPPYFSSPSTTRLNKELSLISKLKSASSLFD